MQPLPNPDRFVIMRKDNSVPEIPAGYLMEFYTNDPEERKSLPSGWIIPDGREVSRSEFADLFESIGTLYGKGDGKLTFNLPDFRAYVK